MRSLVRSQLRAALTVVTTLMLTLGALPVVFWLLDGLTELTVFGVPAAVGGPRGRGLSGPVPARLVVRPPGRAGRARLRRARRPGRPLDRTVAVVNATYGVVAITLVAIATIGIGAFGLRISRTTSDFYVASRSVSPALNSSAIGGEYLSAASFLGVAGLVLATGAEHALVPDRLDDRLPAAAGVRRRTAAALGRLHDPGLRPGAAAVRRASGRSRALLVVGVGWLYLMPQFQGAGLTMRTVTGAPDWVGTVLVAVIVDGQRGVGRHAQHHVRPGVPVLAQAHRAARARCSSCCTPGRGDGGPHRSRRRTGSSRSASPTAETIYLIYSVMVATFLGTMGLPHVVVRFYTNPDGHAARRTTLIVLALLGTFYLLPTIYGVLGRIYARDLIADRPRRRRRARAAGPHARRQHRRAARRAPDGRRVRGVPLDVVGPDDVGRRRGRPGAGRRGPHLDHHGAAQVAAVGGVVVPLVLALSADRIAVASSVTFAFALAASTFCPLLVLGIWWRGLTAPGAIAGLVGGGLCAGLAPIITIAVAARRLVRRAGEPARGVVGAARVRPDDRRLARHAAPACPPTSPGRWCGCTPPRASTLDRAVRPPFVAPGRPFVVRGRPHDRRSVGSTAAPPL